MGAANVWLAPWGVLTEDLIERADEMGPLRVQARTAAMQARATIEAMHTQHESNVDLIQITRQSAIATDNLVSTTAALVDQTRRLVRSTWWVAGFTAVAAVAAGAAAIVAATK